jgi:hypothetical protein
MCGKPVCMSTVGGAILRLFGVIRRNISPNGLLATDERGDRAIVTKWRKRLFVLLKCESLQLGGGPGGSNEDVVDMGAPG